MSALVSFPSNISHRKDLSVNNVDLKKAMQRYEENGKKFLLMGGFKTGKTAFKLLLEGELTTNGISVAEFDKTNFYSLGLQFDREEDLDAFTKFNNCLIKFIGDDDWEISNLVKDDKIYLKLKTNQKKNAFEVVSNVKLDPKRPQESGLFRGQKLTVTAELGCYFNLNTKKAGLTLTVRKLNFEQEEEVVVKKDKQ